MNNNLGKKIYDLRVLNKDSQENLAQKINTSRQTISKWESGHSSPDFNTLFQIAQLYGKDMSYFSDEPQQKVTYQFIFDKRNFKLLMVALGMIITSVVSAVFLIVSVSYLVKSKQHNKL